MILTTIENRIQTISFNRPEKKNAITNQMYLDAVDALQAADANPEVRCVIFTGEGGNLTSGNDLVDFIQNPPQGDMPPVLAFLLAIARLKKPIVVAINGLAVGIGTTMLAHCDYVVAAEDSRFKLPFVDLGVCPEGGSSLLLPKLMGHAHAAELLMLADIFDVKKADKVGLINTVVPAAEVREYALKIATKFVQRAPAAVMRTKAMLKQDYLADLEKRMADEVYAFRDLLESPEAKEALTAFMEKRAPDFSRF